MTTPAELLDQHAQNLRANARALRDAADGQIAQALALETEADDYETASAAVGLSAAANVKGTNL